MTYCVGFLLQQGMVFASDTRTNAGVDQVAIVPKMHIFEVKNERVIVLMTAGNLAITQSVVNSLKLKLMDPENKNLNNVGSLFEAASLVGDEVRATFARDGAFLKDHDIDFNATILIGARSKARYHDCLKCMQPVTSLKSATTRLISRSAKPNMANPSLIAS